MLLLIFLVFRGPIFFYCGNEGPIDEFYNNTGFMFDIAPEFNAVIIFAEHRYYGESLPYGEDCFMKANIGHLSVDQALADYAALLLDLKPKYNNTNVITFGGSYGGMLSGWMRMKYPFIVDMALAASAPYLDFVLEYSETAFFQTVTNTFASTNPTCPQWIRRGFSELLALAAKGEFGLIELSAKFKLCRILRLDQVQHLVLWAVNAFVTVAMCDYPYPTNFIAPLPAWPAQFACTEALKAPTPLEGLVFAAGLPYNGTSGSLKCFDIESEFVECSDQTGCGTGPAGIAWDYQACTENIFRPVTTNVTDMFPPHNWSQADLDSYCKHTFGVTPRPHWISQQYGTQNINASATRIIFSNGLLDPWHVGGFLTNLSDTLPAVIISVCLFCHIPYFCFFISSEQCHMLCPL
jgi:dipeptidyl-peptidase-2